MNRLLLSVFFVLIMCESAFAQDYRRDQELFLEAEYFFMFEDYNDALPSYLQLFTDYPENYNLAFRIGLCYLNITGRKNLSVSYLETAAKNSSANFSEGTLRQSTAPYDAWYYLAVSYRLQYQFEKAIEAFKTYSETLLHDDTENILFIKHQIEVCSNASDLVKNQVNYIEENIGTQFNDSYSNFNPVISSDGNSLAYMSSLKFYDAIFYSTRHDNRWTSPMNITPDIQSDGDLYISCITADGGELYLSRDDDNNSDIYKSTFNGTRWTAAQKLGKTINTRYWETHAFVSEDEKTMVFASDRPGGFGGLDLYMTFLDDDGSWGEPINLGPEINTPFNEDRPFLVQGVDKLFFSSQGHYNMGGFDLFKSSRQQNGKWSKPENLGYPINTPDDDIFFMPVDNGESGYLPVYKEGTGQGKEDIYFITFK